MALNKWMLGAACALALSSPALDSRAEAPKPLAIDTATPKIEESLVREGAASIRRGVEFLLSKQMPDGSWCDQPAITALACLALHNSHPSDNAEKVKEAIEKGRLYILKFVQPDGSIWPAGRQREFPTYTTSIVLSGLAIWGKPEDEAVMRRARKYLLGQQLDESSPTPVAKDNPSYGGIGYGRPAPGAMPPKPQEGAKPEGEAPKTADMPKPPEGGQGAGPGGPGRPGGHGGGPGGPGGGKPSADLSNTAWAMEAIYLTDYLDKEPKALSPEDAKKTELAWQNVVGFLSRMQHLPESNDQVWVVSDKADPNYGGFIYRPVNAADGGKFGKQSLSSYGSMTYSGLKSMIYAKLSKDDPRVKAAVEWARKHYTVDENPGMGPNGLYYYLVTLAKAHSVMGSETVATDDGQQHVWRRDLVKKLLELQKGDGSWFNEQGRWMESVPELVTGYSLISLEAALEPCLGAK